MTIDYLIAFQDHYNLSDITIQNIYRFINVNSKSLIDDYDDIKYNPLNDCFELYKDEIKKLAIPRTMVERDI